MTLKTCSCGSKRTTRNSKKIGRTDEPGLKKLLWFNCLSCKSTFVLASKTKNPTQEVA